MGFFAVAGFGKRCVKRGVPWSRGRTEPKRNETTIGFGMRATERERTVRNTTHTTRASSCGTMGHWAITNTFYIAPRFVVVVVTTSSC